jgi:hypothetical protein
MRNIIDFNPVLPDRSIEDRTIYNLNDLPCNLPNESQSPKSNWVFLRRRIFLGVVLIVIGALFWTALTMVIGIGETKVGADLSSSAAREVHVVAPGETLWSIATAIDSDGDPRDTVDRLSALNGGSLIYIGQRLILSN